MNQEEAFIKAFIIPHKRSRYLTLLSSRKRRRDILDRLNHNLDFDSKYSIRIPPEHYRSDVISKLLKQRGAPSICHIISSWHEWDGQDIPLDDALELVVGFGIGTVLCCVPGHLAYYEAEDAGERFILSKE
jgi:hypothetical protein